MTVSRSQDLLLPPAARARNVTAILGPTNTGKTHLAIERMLGHSSGMIGLPLRLLAREVYNKIVDRIGEDSVALITGEEKIKPRNARYYVCTIEAMPIDLDVAFLAIDEIQLAADFDRGHVFTDRILYRRGREETLVLGAATIRPLVESLLPGVNILARPRLSKLTYSGAAKLTRLPRRTAIVAFSADEVYAVAELIRRHRGGAAVVLGALSPRTRNAQVGMYQNGEVDYLVATDAIGMGLNLDIDHVAFASSRKFDGHKFRSLSPAEMAQIAGRAGRHLRDGTFGVTGRTEPFSAELVERLENHHFDPLKILQWRNPKLHFSSYDALKQSLAQNPAEPGLTLSPTAADEMALHLAGRDPELLASLNCREDVERLWDTCQIPDYRKIAPANHADMVATIFRFLESGGTIPDDWFANQIAFANRPDGDIDTLSNRIAHIRTWTFVANRPDWLADPAEWQEKTRAIEDRLSDALHERLAQRFVDRRTSVLMRRLRDESDLDVDIKEDGDVHVEKHFVGKLHGFVFTPDPGAGGTEGKALRAAAVKALAKEISSRATALAAAPDSEIALSEEGDLVWRQGKIARIAASENKLKPTIQLLSSEQVQASEREVVLNRLETWLENHLIIHIGPLIGLSKAEGIDGIARGIAFRLAENFGSVRRREISREIRDLAQEDRGLLRALGVRFGAYAVFVPVLLKPAGANLIRLLWALGSGNSNGEKLSLLPQLSAQGLMSVNVDTEVPQNYYPAIGYHVFAGRAVRLDMLERLADEIRSILHWKPAKDGEVAPEGKAGPGKFVITPRMMSLLGCGQEELSAILHEMGFRRDRVKAPENDSEKVPEKISEIGEVKPEPEAKNDASPPDGDKSTEGDPETPETPEMIEIWSVSRSNSQGKRRTPARPNRDPGKAGPPRQRPGKPRANQRPGEKSKSAKSNGPKKERPLDPDSPFAALAGLKKELGQQKSPRGKRK